MTRLCMLCAAVTVLASGVSAEVHTIQATGEYRMGDNDTRMDAKRLALLDAKRLALEQVGTYVESISEVRNLQLTRDEIRAYTAGIVEVKEAKTRAELDKDGQSTIIYVDVVCEIDTEVLARQMENLRRNESASRELNSLRAENEKLRALVTEQSRNISQAKTKAEQERFTIQRQETLTNIDVKGLLAQAWVALAGSKSSLTVGSSSLAGRQEARRLVTQVLDMDPGNGEAHFHMGTLLHEEGDLGGAISEYQQAIKINPDGIGARLNLGVALRDKGDIEGSINELSRVIKINPNSELAYYNLGLALKDKGELGGAIIAYQQAIKIKPDDVLAHANLGLALKDKGDLGGAISEYQQAIKINPNYPHAHSVLAFALYNKGDLKGAIQEYRTFISMTTDEKLKQTAQDIIRKIEGELEGATNEYRQAIRENPSNALAHNDLGKTLAK